MTNIKAVVADSGSLLLHNVKPHPYGWVCILEYRDTWSSWLIRRKEWLPPCDHVGDAFMDEKTPVVVVAPSTEDADELTAFIQKIREQS